MIIQGDALTELRKLPSESVDCCVTSPPYWALRDYGLEGRIWDGDPQCEHQWESPETTLHYGESSFQPDEKKLNKGSNPNSTDHQKMIGGKCTKCGAWRGSLGLEPDSNSYINHLCNVFDEVKRVLKPEGSCWINMGDTYTPDKCLCQIPARFSIEMCDRGWILRNDIVWKKPNCMPSSVKDRFTVDYEHLYFFVKQPKYYFKTQYEPLAESTNFGIRIKRSVWSICPARFKKAHFATYPEKLIESPIDAGCPEFICNKCGKARKPIYEKSKWEHQEQNDRQTSLDIKGMITDRGGHRNDGLPYKIKCPTNQIGVTWIDCGCNSGWKAGTVLDPFNGAGTTGVVAKKQGKNYIGIELNPEYCKMSEERIAEVPTPIPENERW